ncbi:hypothetical protein AYO51_08065 [Lactiplantibacillus plantarum]|nr:hypothetical protein AYO51_08065 [Lactiplantibacillus plantarum]KYM69777.1 hypothetical protein AZJ01_13665 [Lactiplantibacillus plantarum]
MFLMKISLHNLRSNKTMTLPYLIASSIFTSFLFILLNLYLDTSIRTMHNSSTLKNILMLGVILLTFLAFVFMIYASSYLTKLRAKELSLYSVLGMNKKQISVLLIDEELIFYLLSIFWGLIFGAIFSRFLFLILQRMVGLSEKIKYSFSTPALGITSVVIGAIYLIIIAISVHRVYGLNIKELSQTQKKSENSGKIPWLFGSISFFTLMAGYVIAVITKNPATSVSRFEVASLLVILGIFGTFMTSDIVILNMLKKNSKIYYNSANFFTIATILHRLKRSSVALATICLLCTATLVTVTTLSCFYVGKNSLIQQWFPRQVMVTSNSKNKSSVLAGLKKAAAKDDIKLTNFSSLDMSQSIYGSLKGNFFNIDDSINAHYQMSLVSLNSFEKSEKKKFHLKPKQVLIFIPDQKYKFNSIKIHDRVYSVKKSIQKVEFAPVNDNSIVPNIYIISGNTADEFNMLKMTPVFKNVSGFDLNGSSSQKDRYIKSVESSTPAVKIASQDTMQKVVNSLFGGLLFIGLILSLVFIFITAFTMYYKQISEGFEDKSDFNVLHKLGMNIKEIRKTINKQVIITAFSPLIFAIINQIFAFPIILKILKLLSLTNDRLFIVTGIVTSVAFLIFYTLICLSTTHNYFVLIEGNIDKSLLGEN